MQEKSSDYKKEIRSVLLTYPVGVTLEEFLKTYSGLLGKRLPSRLLGFHTDIEFLQSMPDVVSISTNANGKVLLSGIADEKSQHIQNLVSKQRITKPNKTGTKRQPVVKPQSNNAFRARKLPPFLPASLKMEILQLMAVHPEGITYPAFALAYSKKFNKYLSLERGFDSLEDYIKLIPELEVKQENNVKKIFQKDLGLKLQVKENGYNSFAVHESGIADDILEGFQQVLKKYPEGILDIHFPPLYESVTGKTFDLHGMGYNSMLDVVDALPHIFKRILNPEESRNWILLPTDSPDKHNLQERHLSASSFKKSPPLRNESIPPDASLPALQYIQPTIPDNLDLSQHVPVFVSAIISPSLFWFQLQTDEAIKNFEIFENDMGIFYESASLNYKMNSDDIVIGATCIILSPDDKKWYRAVVKSLPNLHHVNVSYVDYGGNENVPKDNLFYVRSKYHEFPACAFKAELAGLKPSQDAWSFQALQRFVQLCNSGILMAKLKSFNKDLYSVYLCDTNGDLDIHLDDVLVMEGYAELSIQDTIDDSGDYDNKSADHVMCNGVKTDLENGFSSKSEQDMSQSDNCDSLSESENLSAKRKLCFSPTKMECNSKGPNMSSSEELSNSRRYVKIVEICEEIKMHFIKFENELYMSCASVSNLIWSDKEHFQNFLIERLKYKEVDVPFIYVPKENNAELFNQCIRCKIPEYEMLESPESVLVLCPIKWALAVLNIFGQPSLCLRLVIQDEIRKFDPFDTVWKEFCFKEHCDLTEAEKEIERKLSKLCLYDLRAKNEALKIRRLKLLRIGNISAEEEIKSIDVQQWLIGRRMKQIEALCSQYT